MRPIAAVLIFATAAAIFAAAAAQQQRPFVPYPMDQQPRQALVNYLGDVPAKYANPIFPSLLTW